MSCDSEILPITTVSRLVKYYFGMVTLDSSCGFVLPDAIEAYEVLVWGNGWNVTAVVAVGNAGAGWIDFSWLGFDCFSESVVMYAGHLH